MKSQSALDLPGGVESTAQSDMLSFKQWFGGSAVIDDFGKPRVVYHGTQAPGVIDSFQTQPPAELGAHFGSFAQANCFVGKIGTIYSVYLSIKKPLLLCDLGRITADWVRPQLDEMGLPEPVGEHSAPGDYLRARITQAGYDGVVYLNRREGNHDPFGADGVDGNTLDVMSDEEVLEYFPDAEYSFIAFSPGQIQHVNDEFINVKPTVFAQADAQEFVRWFNGSKVVDVNDKPLVVYHGTTKSFETFSREKLGEASGNNGFLGAGFYFSADTKLVASYADGDGGNIMPVYLSLKNPLRIQGAISKSTASAINEALDVDTFNAGDDEQSVKGGLSYTFITHPELALNFTNKIEEAGFDGIIFGHMQEVVVFEPEQIKSAIGNNDGFDNTTLSCSLLPLLSAAIHEDVKLQVWFGDGTMVDDVGDPLVLYHGTNKVFNKFKPSKIGAMGPGVYLGDDRGVAECYDGDGTGKQIVMEVYARGKYLDNMQWSDYVYQHGWASAVTAAQADGWAGVHDTKFESAVCVWDPQDIRIVQSRRSEQDQSVQSQKIVGQSALSQASRSAPRRVRSKKLTETSTDSSFSP